MKKLFLLTILFGLAFPAHSQERYNLSGVIQTSNNTPVKGAVIGIEKSQLSVKTNKKGEFILKETQSTDNIEVIINKNMTAKFPINGNKKIKIDYLENEIKVFFEDGNNETYPLSEISREKRRKSGVVTADMITKSNATSLSEVVRRLIPSVNMSASNGAPRFRGITSINSSAAGAVGVDAGALILVNGVEMSFESANTTINVQDIARIEAIRDGAGYGIRGNNGVILISTKE